MCIREYTSVCECGFAQQPDAAYSTHLRCLEVVRPLVETLFQLASREIEANLLYTYAHERGPRFQRRGWVKFHYGWARVHKRGERNTTTNL